MSEIRNIWQQSFAATADTMNMIWQCGNGKERSSLLVFSQKTGRRGIETSIKCKMKGGGYWARNKHRHRQRVTSLND